MTSENAPKRGNRWIKRVLRIIYDAIRGFFADDCYSKASALTFYSLLSIVPILAVIFGIAKGFGFEKALEKEIIERFSEQKEVMDHLIQFAYSTLLNTKGGLIAGIGVFVLFWSVLGLLSYVETSLNGIWKVPHSRPYSRKISDYLATMVICPLFLVTSSSITVFLTTQITATAQSNPILGVVSPYLLLILKFFPYLLSTLLFTFIYQFMPNTKVYPRSSLIAGFLAGTAFQLWQWIYIKFQIGVSSYGAIYGSFAALPLFLIWIQVSWLILLAGAELAFEIENDLFLPFRKAITISKKAAALLITYRCIESFVKGDPPHTERTLAHELGISLSHLHSILDALLHFRILSPVSYGTKVTGYQPAKAIDTITLSKVCDAIDKNNEFHASVEESSSFRKIQDYLEQIEKTQDRLPINLPLYEALKG